MELLKDVALDDDDEDEPDEEPDDDDLAPRGEIGESGLFISFFRSSLLIEKQSCEDTKRNKPVFKIALNAILYSRCRKLASQKRPPKKNCLYNQRLEIAQSLFTLYSWVCLEQL